MTGGEAFLEMATVLRPWGREGAVAVSLSTDRPDERFQPGVVLEARLEDDNRSLTVSWWRPRRRGAVLKFEEVGDIDGAEVLRGGRLGMSRARTEEIFGDRMLLDDLRGLSVETPDGRSLGVVEDLEEAGPQLLLVVDTPSGEVLVPFHEDLCREVSPEKGRLVLDPPEGLFPGGES